MSQFSTSLSGIQSAFLRQSVSSNDIANLNTDGFKQSRVDQSSNATGGSRIDATATDNSQGPIVQTGRPQDVAIQGDGFFVQQGEDGNTFTRSGSLGTDANGNLVNQSTGSKILGFPGGNGGTAKPLRIPQNQDGATLSSFSISQDGTITGQFSDGQSREIGQLAIASFNNSSGLSPTDGTSFNPTANSGQPQLGQPGQGGRGRIISGALEASNTDLVDETLQQILSQRSVSANVGALKTQDEMLGAVLDLKG